MNISILCPTCGRTGRVPESAEGRRVVCPACNNRFVLQRVPGNGSEPIPGPVPEPELEPEPIHPERLGVPRPSAPPFHPPPAPALPGWVVPVLGGGGLVLVGLVALVAVLLLRKPEGPPARPEVVAQGTLPELPIAPPEVPAKVAEEALPVLLPPDPIVKDEAKPASPPPRIAASPAPWPVPTPGPAPPPAAGRSLTTAEIVERCDASIALIRGRVSSGTGFVIRPGVIATNAHVIDDEFLSNLEVMFPAAAGDGRGPRSVDLLYEDPRRDLAFLAVKTDLPPLGLASRFLYRKGEDVTVIGSPGFGDEGGVLENAVSRGVLSVQTKVDGRDFYQLGIAINHGNSGGPVLDSRGEVIGVATLKATSQEGVAFCIPIEDLNDAVAKLATLSAADKQATRARHRLPLAFRLLTAGGAIQVAAVEGMLANVIDRPRALEALGSLDRTLFANLRDEARQVAHDSKNYPDPVREGILKLSNTYADLKTMTDQVAQGSPSDPNAMRNRSVELRRAHFEAVSSLMTTLKTDVPGPLLALLRDGVQSNPKDAVVILVEPPGAGGNRPSLHDRFGIGPRITPRLPSRGAIPARPPIGPRSRGRLGR